jgi:hypothetical protein
MSPACLRPMRGWLRGCFTATVTIELCVVLGLAISAHRILANEIFVAIFVMFVCAPLVWLVTCALTGVPAILAIRLSERFRIHSVLFFSCVGAAIGVLVSALLFRSFNFVWLFALPGCLAGITYWYVSGRYAGQDDTTTGAFDIQ